MVFCCTGLCASVLQGGVTLLFVLVVAHQVALGLQHLHSLGIIHRDGRASNVLLAGLDPVMALLADLGVSHRLAAFLGDAAPVEAPSKMGTYLEGEAVKGPFLWGAPEVIAGTRDRTAATFATDVHIFGGLLYEMLTGGRWPFHWLAGNASSIALLRLRRQSAEPVPVPAPDGSVHLWPGLLNKSVLEAAELDRVRIPWCVNTGASPGSPGRLEELKAVMAECLAADPGARPKLPALVQRLAALLATETAETAQAQDAIATAASASGASLPAVRDEVAAPDDRYSGGGVGATGSPSLSAPAPAPVADDGEPPPPTGVTVDAARVCDVMQALGIHEDLCDAVAGVVMVEFSDCVDVALLPKVMRTAGVPAVHVLHAVCGVMQVGVGPRPLFVRFVDVAWQRVRVCAYVCVRFLGARRGMPQVEYPAGQVSPPALMSALTRAGVGADTLNSVAGKLLAAPYLQGGVPLDTLSSNSSPLLDRGMHGGTVKPTVVLAVKKALGVRLSGPSGCRCGHPHGHCRSRVYLPATRLRRTPPPRSSSSSVAAVAAGGVLAAAVANMPCA